jgi:hypothetical protein
MFVSLWLVVLVACLMGTAGGFLLGLGAERRVSQAVTRNIVKTALAYQPPGESPAVRTVERRSNPIVPEPVGHERPRDTFEREPEPDQSVIPQDRGAADFSEAEITAGTEQLEEMYRLQDLPAPDLATLRQHAMQLLAGEPVEGSM